MTLTFQALCYLHAFEHRLPIQNGLAFETLLRTARLDYSVQSLERIDVFLDALRKTRKVSHDTYLDDLATQNLLYLLAFYVGEVIGRSLGAAPQWATYAEMEAREKQLNGPHFENSVTLLFPLHLTPRSAWLLPLVSICSRLFDEHVTKSVLLSAGLMLPPESQHKPASQQPLPPIPPPAWPVDVGALARDWGRRPTMSIELEGPPWARDDDLRYLFDSAKALLQEGRVVWGALVQVNQDLFNPAGQFEGAPGEVLYDPAGRVPREDLAEMASKVFSLKGQAFSDPAAARFSTYLADETTRVFGLDVPAAIFPYPLKVSSTWFQRAHLPGGAITDKLVPLLISDAYPGAAMPLPAVFFPGAVIPEPRPAPTPGPGGYVPDPELEHLEPASLAEEGRLWFQGLMVQQDYGKARAAWEKAAARGNPAALHGLGTLYEKGLGVPRDADRALDYYEQAEAKDYEPATEAADRLRTAKRGPAAESRGLMGRLFGKK